jgi:hypothetical protein
VSALHASRAGVPPDSPLITLTVESRWSAVRLSVLREQVRTLLRNDPNGIQELSPLIPVLDHWMNLLEFDNFTAPEESCQAEAGRRPFHQPQAELWMGLHDVLEFMKVRMQCSA